MSKTNRNRLASEWDTKGEFSKATWKQIILDKGLYRLIYIIVGFLIAYVIGAGIYGTV